eukprot:15465126-Alexandrium_andersonii.AAC.1
MVLDAIPGGGTREWGYSGPLAVAAYMMQLQPAVMKAASMSMQSACAVARLSREPCARADEANVSEPDVRLIEPEARSTTR